MIVIKNTLKIFSKLSYDFLQKDSLRMLRLLWLLIKAYKIQRKSCTSIYEYCVASITVKTSNYNSTYKSSKTKIRSISQEHQTKIWKWTPAFFTSCKWDQDPLHFLWNGEASSSRWRLKTTIIHAQKLDTSFKMCPPHLTGFNLTRHYKLNRTPHLWLNPS